MYNRIYGFLDIEELAYSLQFGLRQKHSTIHALTHLTGKIKNEIDKRNYASEIYVDFQNAFDTMDQQY